LRLIFNAINPAAAGTISGAAIVCKGDSDITYTVPDITNATSYIWTLPIGATGTSTTSSILVSYSNTAISGNIIVKGHNDCSDGAESTYTVIVNEIPATPIISLNNDTLESNATNGNQWYFNNSLIQNATNNIYSPSNNGDYYVIVTLNSCSSQQSNVISFNPTKINETVLNNGISVYPNPTTGITKITLNNNFNSVYTVGIFDNVGELLQTLKKSKSEVSFDLDLGKYSTGAYFIRIYNSDKYYQFKVVKK